MHDVQIVSEWLKKYEHTKLKLDEKGIAYANKMTELITEIRKEAKKERNLNLPPIWIYQIFGNTIQGISTRIAGEYHVFFTDSCIEAQEEFLKSKNYNFLQEESKEEYITKLINYGVMFIVFHEVGHIYCGHTFAAFTLKRFKRIQEYEADLIAFEAMVKWIVQNNEEKIADKVADMFVAVYFIFEKMRAEKGETAFELLPYTYLNPEVEIESRDHPLGLQRLFGLFKYLNVFEMDESGTILSAKDIFLEKVSIMKGKTEKRELRMIENTVLDLLKGSIKKIEEDIEELRHYIQRVGPKKE